ncbi:uncharacterized protein LOC106178257 [Lingula anatina]|uniref:Delta-like protein n=1 Tax=Lingula anatina TaxID=7574 RepID=A0A1S3K2G2_LINAN|nr:uncharacterized protein LOC106178257 [Lingula anatina]|eukprot:XP_013416828.1 uncharacterized protein LOC106178257 [Lingula anatina]
MKNTTRLFCLLLIQASVLKTGFGKGKLYVKLVQFSNTEGTGSNGNCCDFPCVSKCDHMFTVCVDKSSGFTGNINSCGFGKVESGAIMDQNTITFGSSFGGVPNPVVLKFDTWPGSAFLKVEVWDDDSGVNHHDHVDYLKHAFSVFPNRNGMATRLRLRNRVNLVVEVHVSCDEDWYGSDCATLCQPRNDTAGHYTCHPVTGKKICLPGWRNSTNNCVDIKNDCKNEPCSRGAQCINLPSGFRCICPDGYTGTLCETVGDGCHNVTCLNGGTCTSLQNSSSQYSCLCKRGYSGERCQVKENACSSHPCQNNATCTSNETGIFHCICASFTSGIFCENDLREEANSSTTYLPVSLPATIATGNETFSERFSSTVMTPSPTASANDSASNNTTSSSAGHLPFVNCSKITVPVYLSRELDQPTLVRKIVEKMVKHLLGADFNKVNNIVIGVDHAEEQSYHVMNLQFVVSAKPTEVTCPRLKAALASLTPARLAALLAPLQPYEDDGAKMGSRAAAVREDQSQWLNNNWYIPLTVGLLTISATLTIVALIIRRKRASQSHKNPKLSADEEEERYATIGEARCPPQPQNNASKSRPPLAFQNSAYDDSTLGDTVCIDTKLTSESDVNNMCPRVSQGSGDEEMGLPHLGITDEMGSHSVSAENDNYDSIPSFASQPVPKGDGVAESQDDFVASNALSPTKPFPQGEEDSNLVSQGDNENVTQVAFEIAAYMEFASST